MRERRAAILNSGKGPLSSHIDRNEEACSIIYRNHPTPITIKETEIKKSVFLFLRMAYSKSFVISILCLILQLHVSAAQTVKGGYWFFDGGLAAADIDASLFTHLFCAFADLDSNTNQLVIADYKRAQFAGFTQTFQQRNPSVKTLLSIGGGSADKAAYSAMASQPYSRRSFIDSSIRVARENNFHGLDLDWEYPASDADRINLGSLLREWREAVSYESWSSGRPALLLSAAVPGHSQISPLDFYPTDEIRNNLDWINIMVYDFYLPTDENFVDRTQAPAPLFNPPAPFRGSGDAGVTEWIQKGVPANKLVFGLPFYGYAWNLLDANSHGVRSPANGAANVEGRGSALTYIDIIGFIKRNSATVVYNTYVVSYYCYSGTAWIGFDGPQSISAKVAYAKQRGLLGYFAWHIAQDNNWSLSRSASGAWGSNINMNESLESKIE